LFVHISVDLSRVGLSFSFIVPDTRVLLRDLHLEPNLSPQLSPWKLRKVKYVIEYSYLNSRWFLSFQLGSHPGSLIFLHTILQPFFSIVIYGCCKYLFQTVGDGWTSCILVFETIAQAQNPGLIISLYLQELLALF